MNLTVLPLAAPALSADLKLSSSRLLWIVDTYGFLVAAPLVTMGTLGGAVGAAGQLPGSLGATLLDTVRGAFLQPLELAAVSSVVEVGTGVTAMILLRQVRAASDFEDG